MFDFANQFGTDIYAEILLNVLMEGLMNDETLFVSGKSEQTEGDQIGDGPPIAQNPKIQADQSQNTEFAPSLGTQNSADYS